MCEWAGPSKTWSQKREKDGIVTEDEKAAEARANIEDVVRRQIVNYSPLKMAGRWRPLIDRTSDKHLCVFKAHALFLSWSELWREENRHPIPLEDGRQLCSEKNIETTRDYLFAQHETSRTTRRTIRFRWFCSGARNRESTSCYTLKMFIKLYWEADDDGVIK